MADTVTEAPAVNATMNETAANATTKIPATPEGMAIAYGSLCLMAVLPIFYGAVRSVKYHADQRVSIFIRIHVPVGFCTFSRRLCVCHCIILNDLF